MRGLQRWAAGLSAVWAGVLLALAVMAAPAVFATLSSNDAGRVVGRLFAQEADFSLAMALLLIFIEQRRARRDAETGRGSVLSPETVLLLGTLFCTVAGYFAIQPMMAETLAGQATWSFGLLHAVSGAFYALKVLLVVALGWRFGRR